MTDVTRRDFHGFLLDRNGNLNAGARQLPEVRNYIQNLPETASTFDTAHLPMDCTSGLTELHFELCKAWPFVEDYGPTGDGRRFVNPNYVHANRLSDVIVECECGARFVKNYEVENSPIQEPSEHNADCLPFDRLRARAEMNEKRWRLIKRLGWLGWKGPDIGPRLGVTKNHTGAYVRDYNFTLRENYEQYRKAVGKTTAYLVVNDKATLDEMAGIYGHTKHSIRVWAKEHSDYEPGREDVVDVETPPKVKTQSVDIDVSPYWSNV